MISIEVGGRRGVDIWGLNDQLENDFWLEQIFKKSGIFSRPRVSLGPGNIPAVVSTSTGVPELVPEASTITKTTLPPQIDRRDLPPTTEVVPVKALGTVEVLADGRVRVRYADGTIAGLFGHREAFELWKAKTYPPEPETVAVTNPLATPTTKNPEAPMDLGNLISDLGTAYITSKYSQPTVQPVQYTPQVQPAFDPFDLPFVDIAPDGTMVRAKKKCRRRRRRLATKSDLGDLAALKAILGNGEAFKAWIATHSR